MQNNGQDKALKQTRAHLAKKELRNLAGFLSAWCDAVGMHTVELAERAESVKQRWAAENRLTQSELKRFGSSRSHFYRLLMGQIPVEYGDQQMLQYLSEIFELDVVQLFDTLADRVWPTVHLAVSDYIEAPLKDPAAKGARYFFPPEQLATCSMHHLYLELECEGSSGMHRHSAGTEMMRLDEGQSVALRFPTRAKNRQKITLHQDDIVFFDATLAHQVVNTCDQKARLFISRNYDFDIDRSQTDPEGNTTDGDSYC